MIQVNLPKIVSLVDKNKLILDTKKLVVVEAAQGATGIPGATELIGLTDVDIDLLTLADNDFLQYDLATQKWINTPITLTADHGDLSGLSDDDHSQYLLLAGRSGGQTLIGGTDSGDDLTLTSSSNATKGSILFGTSAYDEVNNRLGIGGYPGSSKLTIRTAASAAEGILLTDNTYYTLRAGYAASGLGYIGGATGTNLSIRANGAEVIRVAAGKIGILNTSPTAILDVKAAAIDSIGIISRGIAGQAGNLFEVRDSSDAILSKIDKDGNLTTRRLITTYSPSDSAPGITIQGSRPTLVFDCIGVTGGLAFNIMKALATNTDPATSQIGVVGVLAGANLGGNPTPQYIYFDARTDGFYNKATLKIDANDRVGIGLSSTTRPTSKLDLSTGIITDVGIITRGIAGQTGNLFEARNSSDVVKLYISADGKIGGGTAAGDDLYLSSTSNATKGTIITDSDIEIALGKKLIFKTS